MNNIKLINFIDQNKEIFIPFAGENYNRHGRGGISVNFIGDDYEYEYLSYPGCASSTGWIETDDKINKMVESYNLDKMTIYFFSD